MLKQNSKVELRKHSPPSGWPLCRTCLGLRSWRKLLRRHYFPSGASHVDTPPSSCPGNTHENTHICTHTHTHTQVSHKQILVSTDLISSLCVLLLYTPNSIQKMSSFKCCVVFLCSVNILGHLLPCFLLTFSQVLLCVVPASGSSGVSPWCSPSGRGRR